MRSLSPLSSHPLIPMMVEDCGGPPPIFQLPPPPRPPYLPSVDPACPFHSCFLQPVIDAEYHSSPALPSLISISIGSAIIFLTLVFFAALICKHQKRMRDFLPCKTLPQNHCDLSHQNGGVIYEDLTNIHPRALPQTPIEMVEVKRKKSWAEGYPTPYLGQAPVFICPPPPHGHYAQHIALHPIYQQINCNERKRNEWEERKREVQERRRELEEKRREELNDDLMTYTLKSYPLYHTIGEKIKKDDGLKRADSLGLEERLRTPIKKREEGQTERRVKRREDPFLLDSLLQLCPTAPLNHQQGVTSKSSLSLTSSRIRELEKVLEWERKRKEEDNFLKLQKQNQEEQDNDSDSGYSHNTSETRSWSLKARTLNAALSRQLPTVPPP